MDKIIEVEELIKDLDPQQVLAILAERFQDQITFSTSFGWEDQVITDMIFSNELAIEVFTLDTGRLFPETYSVWSRMRDRYKKTIKAYYPNQDKLEAMISQKGPNS